MSELPPSSAIARALRVGVSVLLAALLVHLLELRTLAAHLRGLDPAWLLAAVLLSIPQLALCARRWCFVVHRLGGALSFGTALREYYLSTLLNQVAPFGVVGDGVRALRQVSTDGPSSGAALHAIVLERASGQLALGFWALLAVALWSGRGAGSASAMAGLAYACLLVGLVWLGRRGKALWLTRSHAALTAADALPVHLALSSAVVLSMLMQFACAAAAVGVPLDLALLLRVAPPVLVSMALPISLGGLGVREVSSATAFELAGVDAAQGAAVGLVYGLATLLGSLPALFFLRRSA